MDHNKPPAAAKPEAERVDDSDLAMWPHGSGTYKLTATGSRLLVYSQLGDLDRAVRDEAVALSQMAGFLPDIEPDPALVRLIDLKDT